MAEANFILDFQQKEYPPYMEDINEGIVRQVPSGLGQVAILDVGSGKGFLGELFCELGYEVYAIEADPMIAEEARARVSQVICTDLHDVATIRERLQGKKFNYIVFSDVLEHVYDPLQVLRNYHAFLEKDGKILISLPNVVNWLNRLRFMVGRFHYEMTGVMDRTHVRFFTRNSAKDLVKASDYKIESMDYTPFLTRAFLPLIKRWLTRKNGDLGIRESPYYQWYNKFIYPMEYWLARLMPSLFAFRIILVASKIDGDTVA